MPIAVVKIARVNWAGERLRGLRRGPRPAGESAMQMKRYWLVAMILAVTFAACATDRMAHAQNYPARPVKLIVPYAPGGPNDIVARLLTQKLQEALGGNFFVENLPGGGGTIGTGNAANAAPDGYTLLVANQDIIIQPIIRAKVPYDPFKSFAPLAWWRRAGAGHGEFFSARQGHEGADRAAQSQPRQVQLRITRLRHHAAYRGRMAVPSSITQSTLPTCHSKAPRPRSNRCCQAKLRCFKS